MKTSRLLGHNVFYVSLCYANNFGFIDIFRRRGLFVKKVRMESYF